MVTIYKTDKTKSTNEGTIIYTELRGLSTDEKPTEIGDKIIGNGSVFIETDTQKLYFYDAENSEWIGE